MMVRFTLQRDGGSCVKFISSARMLKLFNVNTYDLKNLSNSKTQRDSQEDAFDEILNLYPDDI